MPEYEVTLEDQDDVYTDLVVLTAPAEVGAVFEHEGRRWCVIEIRDGTPKQHVIARPA